MPKDIDDVLGEEIVPPTYHEMSMIPHKDFEEQERTGVRSSKCWEYAAYGGAQHPTNLERDMAPGQIGLPQANTAAEGSYITPPPRDMEVEHDNIEPTSNDMMVETLDIYPTSAHHPAETGSHRQPSASHQAELASHPLTSDNHQGHENGYGPAIGPHQQHSEGPLAPFDVPMETSAVPAPRFPLFDASSTETATVPERQDDSTSSKQRQRLRKRKRPQPSATPKTDVPRIRNMAGRSLRKAPRPKERKD
ncbi:hypothetical protein LTR93_011203 [Exophiala xenobiotica]|nr:hypothetical protein LTR93_011203 [Exophiala xenobiotica]